MGPVDLDLVARKLRDSVSFLPLKDLRYSSAPLEGHTWFMSAMDDTHDEGGVQFQRFPSAASKGRVLCLKGRDNHDGAWNYYALAWREALPENATFLKGLTFVSYNHYDYDNIWHGLSAAVPFVSWHIGNGCAAAPARWVLYHWGELRTEMSTWLTTLMEATFGGGAPLNIERFLDGDGYGDDSVACFEDAVVTRHNEGGMSRDRRIETYDLLRCKARRYCNVSLDGRQSEVTGGGLPVIGMTMFMRTGARSFKNETAVIRIFEKECRKVEGCRFMVAYSSNLTFCEQVKVMSSTDILISPHGAQLTNMFFMDKNSSVMEFFPKGWLKLAGVGQFVYHWIASWSAMKHEGAWRDPDGDPCPYPDDDRRCMSIYKGGKIGHNETHFSDWAKRVLEEVRMRKTEETSKKNFPATEFSNGCSCG
ncbi:PREDICTED: uncharacterized protein LOC109165637 [Ipomoea nil]|uniref:uncharacterized protein LOC109165637 n=1 Tax=Ipomoea nil TaxID=35883 RepID=UPI000901E1CA|nr:PREDICTED: uncharacterized protein LOC109165637 [Ipomoea nil]